MRKLLAMFVLITLASDGHGTGWSGQPAAYLDLPVGARALGLGGAVGSLAGDPILLHWNPAALAELEETTLELGYSDRALGRRQGQAALGVPWREIIGFGVLANVFSVADIPEMDEVGNQTGSFDDRELALSAGFGLRVASLLRLGVAGRYYSQSLASSGARGFGFDAGLQLRLPLFRESLLRIGASASHLQASLKWDTESDIKEAIPKTYRLGFSYEMPLRVRTLVAYDYVVTTHIPINLLLDEFAEEPKGVSHSYGVEVWPHRKVALRGGLLAEKVPEFGKLRLDEMALGASILVRRVRLDYTYRVEPVSSAATSTLGLRFGF